MNARTDTPDVVTFDENGLKSTRIKLKRACNGCGHLVGDVDNRDVDDHGNLTDVRTECPNCAPVVALEAAGCHTWQLTPRNISRVDNDIDQYGTFAKGYWAAGDDGRLECVGLRIGERPGHVIAFYGDWIIRHPDGHFTVHPGPEVDR